MNQGRDVTVGVVGAGVIGSGVAHSAAQAGYPVILVDTTQEILARSRESITGSIHLQRLLVGKGLPPTSEILGRIELTTDLSWLSTARFVVECVTESAPLKEAVFRKLDAACPPEAIFASATSAIPITRIASATSRPDRVVGIHFMNPVPLKAMVELIGGARTSPETLERARAFLASLGKTAVLVGDAPGFVTNRVLMLTLNEAACLVQDGVASIADIDRIFKGCFEHRMGPLETADMIGLDTVLASLEVLHESFGDDKYRPCSLLRQMVEEGRLGRKSGQGFHEYRVR